MKSFKEFLEEALAKRRMANEEAINTATGPGLAMVPHVTPRLYRRKPVRKDPC